MSEADLKGGHGKARAKLHTCCKRQTETETDRYTNRRTYRQKDKLIDEIGRHGEKVRDPDLLCGHGKARAE